MINRAIKLFVFLLIGLMISPCFAEKNQPKIYSKPNSLSKSATNPKTVKTDLHVLQIITENVIFRTDSTLKFVYQIKSNFSGLHTTDVFLTKTPGTLSIKNRIFRFQDSGKTRRCSYKLPPNFTPGKYYLIVKADSLNRISEVNESNNQKEVQITIRPKHLQQARQNSLKLPTKKKQNPNNPVRGARLTNSDGSQLARIISVEPQPVQIGGNFIIHGESLGTITRKIYIRLDGGKLFECTPSSWTDTRIETSVPLDIRKEIDQAVETGLLYIANRSVNSQIKIVLPPDMSMEDEPARSRSSGRHRGSPPPPPDIIITAPSLNTRIPVGGHHRIRWTTKDDSEHVNKTIKISIWNKQGSSYIPLGETQNHAGENSYPWHVLGALFADRLGQHRVRLYTSNGDRIAQGSVFYIERDFDQRYAPAPEPSVSTEERNDFELGPLYSGDFSLTHIPGEERDNREKFRAVINFRIRNNSIHDSASTGLGIDYIQAKYNTFSEAVVMRDINDDGEIDTRNIGDRLFESSGAFQLGRFRVGQESEWIRFEKGFDVYLPAFRLRDDIVDGTFRTWIVVELLPDTDLNDTNIENNSTRTPKISTGIFSD